MSPEPHHQIAQRGPDGLAAVLHRDDGTGGDGVDLDEYVGREDIVGVDERQQRAQYQVDHDAEEIPAFRRDVLLGGTDVPQQGQEHGGAEE